MTDVSALVSWTSDWSGIRVLVLGLGPTGFACADTLTELGSTVLVAAESAGGDRGRLLEVIGAQLFVGALDVVPSAVVAFSPELVIVSPGFSRTATVVAWAEQQGIPVWGDVELAWRVRDKVRAGDWVSVTGAGASETVDLAVHLLASAGIRTAGVGYRNVPVLDAVRDPGGFDVLVVELSSRHLARLGGGAISPLVSVCLSVSEDSVSEDGVSDDGVVADGVDEDGVSADGDDPAWHASTEARLAALGNVYDATRLACLYNKADEATMHMVEEAEVIDGCRAIGFDFGTPGPSDLGLVGDIVVDRAFHDDRHHSALELTTHGELQAAGLGAPSSVSGVLAASAIARAFGVSPEQVRAGIATFRRTT